MLSVLKLDSSWKNSEDVLENALSMNSKQLVETKNEKKIELINYFAQNKHIHKPKPIRSCRNVSHVINKEDSSGN